MQPATREMVLKIIGAGMPRTGTLSLKVALEQLGFGKCHDIMEVMKNPVDLDIFHFAANGEQVDWGSVFTDEFESAVDMPTMYFYKELMVEYPEAKVILTVRDAETWYESVHETIWTLAQERSSVLLRKERVEKLQELVWKRLFKNRFDDRAATVKLFQKHIEEVKRLVPQERLLVFNVADGWEPLCNFLQVDIPNTPFPNRNTRYVMSQKVQIMRVGRRSGSDIREQ